MAAFPDSQRFKAVSIRPDTGAFHYTDDQGRPVTLTGVAADLAVRNYVREIGPGKLDKQVLTNWVTYAKSLGTKTVKTANNPLPGANGAFRKAPPASKAPPAQPAPNQQQAPAQAAKPPQLKLARPVSQKALGA